MNQNIGKRLLTGVLLAGLFMLLLGCAGCVFDRPYEVDLPFDEVEGAEWTMRQTGGDGKVECVGVKTADDEYWEGRKEIQYQFKGITPGTAELQFQYQLGENTEPVNAYAVVLNIAKDKKVTELFDTVYECSYSSFDGGGPEYWAEVSEEGIVHISSWSEYHQKNHEQLCGAGYSKIFRFSGRKPGKTLVTIRFRAAYVEDTETADTFWLTVDENLHVSRDSVPAENE